MDKLKCCPFCGADAEIMHYPMDGYLPHCSKCDGMIEKWFKTEQEAISAWNTRKEDTEWAILKRL